jgi:nucleoside-diphosphate-sugar epimerase
MNILFIGGTGTISSACAHLALERGFDLTLLNRGRQPARPDARQIIADINDPAAAAKAIGDAHWDAVVDFIAFTPAEIEQRLALFRGRTAQFVFISSASAYQKPPAHFPITESTPLVNPFWDYSRNKIACEKNCCARCRKKIFP